MEAMIQISKENPNQTSPIERALRFHADSKYNKDKFKFLLIESALTQIKQNQYSVEMMEGKGCTANVLMITNNLLICANAGDSRCVLGEGGRAVPMSTDHKPNLKKERDRIYRAGSTVNVEGRIDGNLNLSRAIGDIAHKKNPKL
jgi:serine/threonine protein phosphatase PrpC